MHESFIVYTSWMEQIELLTNEQKGILFTAMMCFQTKKELPEMDDMTKMCFSFIKSHMEKNNEKYEEICEKRRIAGKMGGRPKKANGFSEKQKNQKVFEKSKRKQTKAKKPDNDNDNDNDNEYDNDNDNDNDIKERKVKERIDYQKIINLYNDTCVSLPRCTKLSDTRKRAIKSVLKNYSEAEILDAFYMAEESDFLKGKSSRGWKANIDFIMNNANMAKILDGNYKNRTESNFFDDWGNA